MSKPVIFKFLNENPNYYKDLIFLSKNMAKQPKHDEEFIYDEVLKYIIETDQKGNEDTYRMGCGDKDKKRDPKEDVPDESRIFAKKLISQELYNGNYKKAAGMFFYCCITSGTGTKFFGDTHKHEDQAQILIDWLREYKETQKSKKSKKSK